jgi:hypothetical protein
MCGLAVVNIYQECDREWAKNVSGKLLTACMAIHPITGHDGHALAFVLYAFINQLANRISHPFYHLFDVM